jgi:hypothetical protein
MKRAEMLAELARKAVREGLTPVEQWAARELRRGVATNEMTKRRYHIDPAYRAHKQSYKRRRWAEGLDKR